MEWKIGVEESGSSGRQGARLGTPKSRSDNAASLRATPHCPSYEPGGRWALYANGSIARLARSSTARRLSYGTENSRA